MMQPYGTVRSDTRDTAQVVALAAAGWVVLYHVIGVVAILLGDELYQLTALYRLVWLCVAAAIAAGPVLGKVRPAAWGATAGAGVVAAAVQLFPVVNWIRFDIGDSLTNFAIWGMAISVGLCAAAAASASRWRGSRSPLTDAPLGPVIAGVGVLCGVTLMVPSQGGSFQSWNWLSSIHIETLAWIVVVVVFGGAIAVGGWWRSAFGRMLALGAAVPVAVSMIAGRLDENTRFLPVAGMRPHLLALVAVLAAVGVLVFAEVSASEIVTDAPPLTRPSASAAPGPWVGAPPSAPTMPTAVGAAPHPGVPAVYGSLGARFGAFLLDGLVTFACTLPGYLIIGATAVSAPEASMLGVLILFAGVAVNIVQYCRKMGRDGQSIGYKACGLRLVDLSTGAPIGAGRVFGRAVVRGLGAIPCYLGILWALWQPQRRGWHDLAMNTIVVPASMPLSGGLAGGAHTYSSAPPPPPPLLDAPGAPAPAPVANDETVARGFGGFASAPPPPVADLSTLPPPPVVSPAAPPAPVEFASAPPPPQQVPFAPQIASVPSLDDDRTIARSELRQHTPVAPPTTPKVVLVFDQGRREVLDRTLLVGRDPSPSPTDPGAALIALNDPTMSVSKTHMAIGLDGDEVWVEDRHSTNGVSISNGGEMVKIVAGKRVRVVVGSTVRFGDRSVTVTSE